MSEENEGGFVGDETERGRRRYYEEEEGERRIFMLCIIWWKRRRLGIVLYWAWHKVVRYKPMGFVI